MKTAFFTLAAAAALAIGTSATAAPATFAGNGHSYELIQSTSNVTWGEAKAAAETLGGYLATVTSQAEWDFIKPLGNNTRAWLGGTDSEDYGTTEGNWIWATGPEAGQAFTFTAWDNFEPSGSTTDEDFLEGWWNPDWNDTTSTAAVYAYMIEYTAAVPLPASAPLIIAGFGTFGLLRRRKRA